MEIEITSIPALTPAEHALADMHSLLNIINVVQGELMMLGEDLDENPNLLVKALATCTHIRQSLADPEAAARFVRFGQADEDLIWDEVRSALDARPKMSGRECVQESLSNLRSVFAQMEIRMRETAMRFGQPAEWRCFFPTDLYGDLQATLDAASQNSRGRFGIAFNAEHSSPRDYRIRFEARPHAGRWIHLPLVVKDVLRDLVSNSRKYSPVGASITVALTESAQDLRLVVEDTGIGIPADELPRVAHFGFRGSRVKRKASMGGGMGLTKAFLVTRSLGGRLWIASEPDKGTRVTLVIPRPQPKSP